DDWRLAGLRSAKDRAAWEKRLAATDAETRAEFERRIRGDLPESLSSTIVDYKRTLAAKPPVVATRNASEMALEVINDCVVDMIGGSADLTGSNNTLTRQLKPITPDDFSGRYIHYGIRELGMAAAMNG